MKYIKGLDSIRAIAVIFVILGHWSIPTTNKDFLYWFKAIMPDAGFGVNLFFVLSGFLITGILLKARESNSSTKTIFKNFYVRRTIRIFPIYYIVILVFYAIGYPFIENSLPYILTYTSNIRIFQYQQFFPFGYSWSLAVEEQFYIIWPLLVIFIKEKGLKFLFPITIFVGFLFNFYTVEILDKWSGQFLVFSCFQAFGIGGWYAYLLKSKKTIRITNWLRFIFILCLMVKLNWSFYPESQKHSLYLVTIVYSVISVAILYLTLNNNSKAWKIYFFENRALNYIGRISYGIYLIHGGIHHIFDKLVEILPINDQGTLAWLGNWKNTYFIKLFLLFLIAHLSFKFIESPLLSFKKKFEYQ